MSKERLEEIEVQGYENDGDNRLFVKLKEDDYLYLKEQAEQVEELLSIVRRKETYVHYLQKQNDRYHEGLLDAREKLNTSLSMSAEVYEAVEIIDKALEGEE